jgi:multidrug/hemolysin transport system permease protein
MRLVGVVLSRNLRGFWRDPMTVVYALLGPFILFILFNIFLRDQVAALIASQIAGTTQDDAFALCDAWLFASVTVYATFTTSLAILAGFVEDRSTGRFSDYLVSPLRRWQLGLGYVGSTLVVSYAMALALMGLGQLWAWSHDQPLMGWGRVGACAAAILLACLVFSALNTLMVTFTPSQGSFGGYSIIAGTAMGFLSYGYVPPAELAQGITNVLGSLPFAQAGAMIRQPFMESATAGLLDLVATPQARQPTRQGLFDALGVNLWVNGAQLSITGMIALILALTVVLALLASWRMGRVIR